MARGKGKRRQKLKSSVVDRILGPTEAREAHNDFYRAGIAFRMVPMIDTLLKAGTLTQAEHNALSHYRDQASRAEDDIAQEGTLAPARIMGGHTAPCGGKIPAILLGTPAILETARIERDLGGLQPIARAVAVDDWTLTRWCIEQHGGRERYDGKGEFVAMVPNSERRVMGYARIELKMAARRIVR